MFCKIATVVLTIVVILIAAILKEVSRQSYGLLNALSRGTIEGAAEARRMRQCKCGYSWDPNLQSHRYCPLTGKRRRWWRV